MNKVIVSMYFNDVNLINDDCLTKEWIDYRINIFMNFTFQSLKKQTNQDFLALLRCNEATIPLIQEALSHYETLPENIKFITRKEKNTLINQFIQEDDYDYVMIVRLDSDDCYEKDYFEKLRNYKPHEETHFLMNQRGFIYDSRDSRLAYWYCKSSPFFVAVYKKEDYLNKVRYKVNRGHTGVIEHPHEILEEGNFMVIVHSKNTLTSFEKRSEEMISDPNEVQEILHRFIEKVSS